MITFIQQGFIKLMRIVIVNAFIMLQDDYFIFEITAVLLNFLFIQKSRQDKKKKIKYFILNSLIHSFICIRRK